jgi:hypothetical protein
MILESSISTIQIARQWYSVHFHNLPSAKVINGSSNPLKQSFISSKIRTKLHDHGATSFPNLKAKNIVPSVLFQQHDSVVTAFLSYLERKLLMTEANV